ncbi:non-homologous end joining protein Ku [Yinghuangia aomiensis]
MPQTIWAGLISWGLVSIPVDVQSAIGSEHDVTFRQFHGADMGRVRVRKVCERDGQELNAGDIVRGFTAPDGRVATVTDAELDALPLPTARAVEVHGFVALDDVDPVPARPALLPAARGGGAKPYVVLRESLRRSGKAAVTKLAMRGKETLALVRQQGDVLVLHRLYWPDEVRSPAGYRAAPSVTVTDAELDAATALMDAIGEADVDSEHDDYAAAVDQVIAAKLDGAPAPEAPAPEHAAPTVSLAWTPCATASPPPSRPGRTSDRTPGHFTCSGRCRTAAWRALDVDCAPVV